MSAWGRKGQARANEEKKVVLGKGKGRPPKVSAREDL